MSKYESTEKVLAKRFGKITESHIVICIGINFLTKKTRLISIGSNDKMSKLGEKILSDIKKIL
jgi:hypothetical protein